MASPLSVLFSAKKTGGVKKTPPEVGKLPGGPVIIDHIGIVVKSLEEAIEHWKTAFGYQQRTSMVANTRQKVMVTFLVKEQSLSVKLIAPTDPTSPVYAFARRGGGLHHLCFKCARLDDEIARLDTLGLRVLVKPQPGEAFENENIAFIFDPQGLNIELIDTDKKAGVLEVAGGLLKDPHPDSLGIPPAQQIP
jgi:methylmalonyl-CoA/ethylmalonyl-CoA epimerase